MTIRILTITVCSLFLINCGGGGGSGKKAESTKGVGARGIPRVSATAQELNAISLSSGTLFGRVYIDNVFSNQTQADFQQQVNELLAPQFQGADNGIGVVNGVNDSQIIDENSQNSTGVAFWGRGLRLKNGAAFNPVNANFAEAEDVFDEETAELRFSVYQAVTRTENEASINVVEEVPIHFNAQVGQPNEDTGRLLDSFVQGRFIQLTFGDQFGLLSFSGELSADGTIYDGQVLFRNLLPVQGDARVLGYFNVNACGFFTCSR